MNKVIVFVVGGVKKYLNRDGSGRIGFSQSVTDELPNDLSYQKCRATMNSSARMDFLVSYIQPPIQHV
jgi:hypothetical protein